MAVAAAFLIIAISLGACDKATPSRVEKKIVKDSWVVVGFTYLGNDIVDQFEGYRFGFAEDGQIVTYLNDLNQYQNGHWEVGLDKDPTVLYISEFIDQPMLKLNDDWHVTTCSNDKITLQSDDQVNSVTLNRLE